MKQEIIETPTMELRWIESFNNDDEISFVGKKYIN
jgi:hypothetical protein